VCIALKLFFHSTSEDIGPIDQIIFMWRIRYLGVWNDWLIPIFRCAAVVSIWDGYWLMISSTNSSNLIAMGDNENISNSGSYVLWGVVMIILCGVSLKTMQSCLQVYPFLTCLEWLGELDRWAIVAWLVARKHSYQQPKMDRSVMEEFDDMVRLMNRWEMNSPTATSMIKVRRLSKLL
jgi:hypothetical protein